MTTEQEYRAVIDKCREIFLKKNQDYGTNWLIFRLSSLTDQIYIKAKRIRTIEVTGNNAVGESLENEYVGIINYSLMAIMLYYEWAQAMDIPRAYDLATDLCYETMQKKNQDYGEAWREMRLSSLTDLILAKLLRIKQIEDNNYSLQASEGVENNYIDCVNYAIFALIKLRFYKV